MGTHVWSPTIQEKVDSEKVGTQIGADEVQEEMVQHSVLMFKKRGLLGGRRKVDQRRRWSSGLGNWSLSES